MLAAIGDGRQCVPLNVMRAIPGSGDAPPAGSGPLSSFPFGQQWGDKAGCQKSAHEGRATTPCFDDPPVGYTQTHTDLPLDAFLHSLAASIASEGVRQGARGPHARVRTVHRRERPRVDRLHLRGPPPGVIARVEPCTSAREPARTPPGSRPAPERPLLRAASLATALATASSEMCKGGPVRLAPSPPTSRVARLRAAVIATTLAMTYRTMARKASARAASSLPSTSTGCTWLFTRDGGFLFPSAAVQHGGGGSSDGVC